MQAVATRISAFLDGKWPIETPTSATVARWFASLVTVSFVASLIGIAMRISSGSITEIWIANAIGAALLINAGHKRQIAGLAGFFTGCLAANLTAGNPLGPALYFAIGNSLEVFLSLSMLAILLQQTGDLDQARKLILHLAVIALMAPAVAGLVATLFFSVIGKETSNSFFWAWWSGSAMGAVVVVPIRLALNSANLKRLIEPQGLVRFGAVTAASIVTAIMAVAYIPDPFVLAMQPLLVGALLTNPLSTSIAASTTVAAIIAAAVTGLMTNHPNQSYDDYTHSLHFFASLTVVAPILVSFLVDDRRKETERVALVENRWAFALDSADQGVWDANLITGNVYWSAVWLRILGYSAAELPNNPNFWLELVHPDDRDRVRQANEDCISGATDIFEQVLRMRHRDGHWVWILDRGKVLDRDQSGRATRMIGTHTDISRRMETEQAIQRLNDRILLATRNSGVGIWEYDIERQLITWDDQMLQLFGIDRATFKGLPSDWLDRVHPDDRARMLAETQIALEKGEPFETNYRIIRPDGKVRYIQAIARIEKFSDHGRCLVGTNWDVTEARTDAETLRLANEGLSEFAAMASHDLQSPLRHLGLYAEILQEALTDHSTREVREAIGGVMSSAATMRQLVRSLLQFSRTSNTSPDRRMTPLRQVVDQALQNLLLQISESKAVVNVGPLPQLDIDPVLMAQVFQNLIENAIRYRSEKTPVIEIAAEEHEDGWQVEIRDNGTGIDPNYAEAIFQPFKRLKSGAGRPGTGIGLSLVRRIIHAHGGTVRLDVDHAGGSRFLIILPKTATLVGSTGQKPWSEKVAV